MQKILQLEELAQLGLSIFLFSSLPVAWWWYLVLFFAPDLGMVGYLLGNKTGAILYNLFHHKAIAIGLYILGSWDGQVWIQGCGLIILGHSSFDRMLGYGLKTYQGFGYTHLGTIGKTDKK